MRTLCAAFVCAIFLAGCGRETPTSPSIPAPPVETSPLPQASAIAGITVFGGSWIVVGGGPLQMTARVYTRLEAPAEFIDDTEHVTWTTEPSGILTIDRQGRVSAVSPGQARVIATVGDRTGRSPNITAVPDFSGAWLGNSIITGCTGHWDFRGCPRLMFSQSDGSRIQYPFSITLSQVQDQVTGVLREGAPGIFARETPMRGFVRLSGALVLEASVPQTDLPPIQIFNWSATMNAQRTQLSGGFTKIEPRRDSLVSYTLRTENEFSGVSRTP